MSDPKVLEAWEEVRRVFPGWGLVLDGEQIRIGHANGNRAELEFECGVDWAAYRLDGEDLDYQIANDEDLETVLELVRDDLAEEEPE